MAERVIVVGLVSAVRYWSKGPPDVIVNGGAFDVPEAEADKALAAKRAGKEIEIAEGNSCTWGDRTVRNVPVVVVKARGMVRLIDSRAFGNGLPGITLNLSQWYEVSERCTREAARAFADDAEVEIVSVDGGPDTVRRVS